MAGIALGDLGLFVAAAALSAAAAMAVRAVALRRGFLDHPAPNKPHGRPMPTLGGIAIACPFLGLLWGLAVFGASPLSPRELAGLTGAGLLLLALGIYDDLHGCGASVKLAVQVVAALVLYGAGFGIEQLTNPFDDAVGLSALALPVTILWIVGITNAINLIDGLDGLASGVVLIAAVTLLVIATRFDEAAVALSALVLAGCVAGFLPFNLPPARLFLGDTGSLFLGATIAAISLLHNRKGALTITLLLPVVLLALPILDTALAFGRRVAGLRHPFRGDTEHLHHRLLRLGLAPRDALVLFYSVSAALGLTAVLLTLMPKQYTMVAVLVLALGLVALLWALFHHERKVAPDREREAVSGPRA
jgi:UDP-GlcNAc:undecaprenyl-phosphate GlcNAc-1-phosphate transferase